MVMWVLESNGTVVVMWDLESSCTVVVMWAIESSGTVGGIWAVRHWRCSCHMGYKTVVLSTLYGKNY